MLLPMTGIHHPMTSGGSSDYTQGLSAQASGGRLSLFGLGRGNVAEVTTRPYVLMVFTDDQPPFGILSRLPFVREFFVENGLELASLLQNGRLVGAEIGSRLA